MKFDPGFRLSKTDVGVITISLIGASALFQHSKFLCFSVLFVVTHFFLFCNIIRMSRLSELIWASVFICGVSLSLTIGEPPIYTSIGCSLIVTIILAALEIQKPSYHGAFWKKLNPDLETWFVNRL